MKHFRKTTAALCTAALCLVRLPLSAAPSVTNDNYTAFEDQMLTIGQPGVLGNDVADPPGSSLNAGVVTPPQHGTLTLNTDGSFSYTPQANYNGPDAFSYRVLGGRTFTIDQNRSVLNVRVRATLNNPNLGTREDTDTGRVSGTATVFLNPAVGPFQSAQVQSLNATLIERVDISLCWQSFIVCLVGLDAYINANELELHMVSPGPPGTVAGDGSFNQPGNIFGASGTAHTSGTGFAAGQGIPETIELNDDNIPYDMTAARVTTPNPATLELKVPVNVVQTFDDPAGDYNVEVTVSGDVYATAPVNPVPESATANVSLNVQPVDDAPTAVVDRYYTRQNLTVTVPASAAASTETLIGPNEQWKYSTGSDLGTAWRGPDFNDAGWAAGTGVLGYGDADILAAGTIPSRANTAAPASASNPNYPTAYFRREFTLTSPFDTVQPSLEVQRDDACIVYVNGTEVYRDKDIYTGGTVAPFPSTGEVAYATYSAATIPGADELIYKAVTFSRGVLREGRNVVAVEVHQASNTSSDLRFDLKLSRTRGVAGVLANDTDPDGPQLSAAVHRTPANGTLTLNPDGSFLYTPGSGYTGTDSFIYKLRQNGTDTLAPELKLVPFGAPWRYLADGTDQGSAWRATTFVDAAWPEGPGELGYGDGDESTVVEDNPVPGPPVTGDTNRYFTTFFRHSFSLPDKDLIQSLILRVVRDDGAAIYLNGTRVWLDNLTEPYNFQTAAGVSIGGADEQFVHEILTVDPALLLTGTNVIAAEIHQADPGSSDVSFHVELAAISVAGVKVDLIVLDDDADDDHMSDTWERANGFNPSNPADAGLDADNDGQSNRSEFLAGTDPRNAGSRFLLREITRGTGNNLRLEWTSAPGRTYRVQSATGLTSWSGVGSPITADPMAPTTSANVVMPALPRLFYRVALLTDWQ